MLLLYNTLVAALYSRDGVLRFGEHFAVTLFAEECSLDECWCSSSSSCVLLVWRSHSRSRISSSC